MQYMTRVKTILYNSLWVQYFYHSESEEYVVIEESVLERIKELLKFNHWSFEMVHGVIQ